VDKKNLIPLLAMPLLLLAVEVGALLLSLPVQASGITAFEDPSSMENPIIFIAILLGFTAFLLVLIKFNLKKVIAAVIGLSIFFTFAYIYAALVYAGMGTTDAATIVVLVLSVLSTLLLYKYPEWYVIDSLGVLIGAGVASIFGVSLEVLPVVLLLVILAVYDAISVYKTKHMITLAEGVVDLKTPILFVIPKRRDYSFIREGFGKISGDDEGEGKSSERAAFIIGMGDMIMPAILVVSANVFIQGTKLGGIVNLPALGAMVGSVAGITVLLWFVMSGKPQAGLPPINGGTILGFLVGWAMIGWA
jgi:presenilin-like A22 family membrane protease